MTDQILESKKKYEIGIIKISRTIALISFVIGTLILGLFYLTKSRIFPLIGLFYLTIAIIINSAFLTGLIVKLLTQESEKRQTLISIGIIILNIPIAYLYFIIAMKLIGTIVD